MPNVTTHYGLTKPMPDEAYDINQFNTNADKLDTVLFKKVEPGEDGKLPKAVVPDLDYIPSTDKGKSGGVATLGADGKVLTSQLPEDIDCGTFGTLTPVAAHNASPAAHRAMTVDGNAVAETGSGGDLTAHATDPLAHQNIILDGNIN